MPSDVRTRALGYLRTGATRVVHARSPKDGTPPHEVVATVQGHQRKHVVDYIDGAWTCTCQITGCPHIAAVQIVTGHFTPTPNGPSS